MRLTVLQTSGTQQHIVLNEVQFVPDLAINLFSITKALDNGWNVSNQNVMVSLEKHKTKITFDKIFRTEYGVVLGIEMCSKALVLAHVNIDDKLSIDINYLHKLMGHPSEDILRTTAHHYGVSSDLLYCNLAMHVA